MRRLVPVSVAGLLMVSVTAWAQEGAEPAERELVLILDASGSMDRLDANGVRLIDGAKQALLDLIDALPDDLQVGLWVYGHRYPNTDRLKGCTDTELIVPIGPLDRRAMNSAIQGIEVQGFTPIGLPLEKAARDFRSDGGAKAIVLVSDGEDTCAPPDPCEIARGLFETGVFMRIETVGLFLDEAAARSQLQCIADATGGNYHDAGTIDLLALELGDIIDDAMSGPEGFLFGGLTATPIHTCCPEGLLSTGVAGLMAIGGRFLLKRRR
jgi:Ca-activated chloride channel family protein